MTQAVSSSRPMTGASMPSRGELRQVATDLVEQRRRGVRPRLWRVVGAAPGG